MTRSCPKDPRLCAQAAGRSQSQLDMGDRNSISSQRARVELPSAKRSQPLGNHLNGVVLSPRMETQGSSLQSLPDSAGLLILLFFTITY